MVFPSLPCSSVSVASFCPPNAGCCVVLGTQAEAELLMRALLFTTAVRLAARSRCCAVAAALLTGALTTLLGSPVLCSCHVFLLLSRPPTTTSMTANTDVALPLPSPIGFDPLLCGHVLQPCPPPFSFVPMLMKSWAAACCSARRAGFDAMLWCVLLLFSSTSQVKTSLGEDAQRSMLTSDEGLLGAVAWAEGQGLDLNVFLDVVSSLCA